LDCLSYYFIVSIHLEAHPKRQIEFWHCLFMSLTIIIMYKVHRADYMCMGCCNRQTWWRRNSFGNMFFSQEKISLWLDCEFSFENWEFSEKNGLECIWPNAIRPIISITPFDLMPIDRFLCKFIFLIGQTPFRVTFKWHSKLFLKNRPSDQWSDLIWFFEHWFPSG
jgi:hypothetical protein